MSLLGKPLNYNRGSRRDARYRRLQSRVYNFLERPRGYKAISYHVLVFIMVFTCLALSVFSTIAEYEEQATAILFVMEIIVVIWFGVEFFLRLWSSGCRSRYQGAVGRLKFLKRPFCVIDIVTIAASIVVLVMGSSGQVFATSALRGLRFFQILRMVRMDRRGGTWKLLGSVVYAHRQELITTLYIGFLGLIFASFLVYLMEKDVEKTKFNNFAQALWWGVITLCTVGYGDMVPETWQGKIIASFCALLGISFFALPAGILGSGFALKVQQQQRQKHMIRRRQPAATLIQSLWRCYAADEHSLSEATWKIHQVPLPSPPPSFRGQKIYLLAKRCPSATERRASSSFKHNASFVARLPTIRRHKSQSLHSPGNAKPPSGSGGGGPGPTGSGGRSGRCPRVTDINASSENLEVTNNGRPMNPSLSEDSVAETALSKKNSDDEDEEPRCVALTNQHKGAIRFIRKLKYFVARRKFREAQKPYDVKDVMEQYTSGHADLLNRVRNLQFRLDQILGKQGSKSKDVYASKISLASRVVKVERQVDDIETKLDTFIELYMQDRKRLLSLPLHADASHSNNPNLPSLPPKGGGASAVITSVTSSSSGSLKPKPILIDKQFSEPNSPIAKTFEEPIQQQQQQKRPPMQRGYSDLGHRIKKRVTLSSIPPQYVGNSTGQTNDRGDVVIVVPNIDPDQLDPVGCIEDLTSVCIDTEIEIEPGSPKTITESSIIMMDEEDEEEDDDDDDDEDDDDDDEEEDIEEEDLDIGAEIDPDSPPWDLYGELDNEDQDETTENTALLQAAAKTEIIVTPISPVSSAYELNRMDSDEYRRSRLGVPGGSGLPALMPPTSSTITTTNGNGSHEVGHHGSSSSSSSSPATASMLMASTAMDSLKPELTPSQQQQQQQHGRIASEDI
ncbi:potassium voltage-gated channel subfamily KQT member 1-like isoform X5 [Uranotaenia lowii]|uniref:potassium voltage-gated channel subfamily KQT member 1-like isoform X5 n=1 Tax=Uranotaenia lowii TaxID=190385 RepID=UPI00247A3E43|nr:potassium voltage-gated channel subfamily KQT member 1-like isoform X5 [Uranotaenia lowii]